MMLLVLLSTTILEMSPPYKLDRGVLMQLEMTEFIAEDWLDPGMFIGDGVRDLCFTTWLTFRTVSNTRF